jgi:hypothetical protein
MVIVAPKFLKFVMRIFHGKKIAETARAMAIFPFIFVRSKGEVQPWLLNHERIHFRQQMEGLFIFFYLGYFTEKFYARYVKKFSSFDSYLYTSAEQEAYLNQNDPHYLSSRPFFRQWRFLVHKQKFELDKNEPGKVVWKA